MPIILGATQSSTANDLIRRALRLIGALMVGQTPSAEDFDDALHALNVMLDSWSLDGLTTYATRDLSLTMNGSTSYTVGPGGALDTAIGVLEWAYWRNDNLDYWLRLIDSGEYAQICQKNLGTVPYVIYDDGQAPQRNVFPYPIPSTGTLHLGLRQPLTAIADASADLLFPPGYEEAITYSLAVRLAPEYGQQIPAEVSVVARSSLSRLKRSNSRPALASSDLVPAQSYNILTG